jgi:hypothetical protein
MKYKKWTIFNSFFVDELRSKFSKERKYSGRNKRVPFELFLFKNLFEQHKYYLTVNTIY